MALKVGELFASFGIDSSKLGKDLAGINKKFGGVWGGMAKAGIAATAAVTAAVVGIGRSVMAVGQTFEATMSEVQAISGATAEEFKILSDTAKEYGRTTKFTASEAGQALKYMALAGWSVEQSTAAIGGVLQLAAASGMDLAAASDAVTDYLSAFGMEAEKSTYLADMMARAQSTSNTSAAQLADAYGNCASSMHAAGQDIETTTAALMIMANQGLKGSEAGTAMAAMMRDLTQKMKNGSIMIGNTAVSVMDSAGNFRDLNDILLDVAAATDGMGSAQKSAALMTTFTARSIKGVNMLLNEGVDSLNQYEDGLRSASGTAATQSETMIGNLSGDMAKFHSAIEGLQIDIYESTSGALRDAVQGATEIIGAFNEAVRSGFSIDKMEGLFETSFDFLGDIGDKIFSAVEKGVAVVGKLLPKLIPKLVEGIKKLLTGISKNLPGLIKGFVKAIPDILGGFVDIIPDLADGLFSALGGAIEQLISDLPRLVPKLIEGIGNILVSAVKGAGTLLMSAMNGIGNLLKQAGILGPSLGDAIMKSIAGADGKRIDELTAYVKGLNFKPDTDWTVDTSEVEAEIQTAIDDIKTSLKGVEGITEEDAEAITNAILNGSGWDTIVAVFDSMDVPDGEAKATEITNAATAIKDGIDKLNLPQQAIDEVYTALQNGEDSHTIAEILEKYGVPEAEANSTASTLASEALKLRNACEALKLPASSVISAYATTDNADPASKIAEILQSYGVPEGTANTAAETISAEQAKITAALKSCGDLPQKAIDEVNKAIEAGKPADEIAAILQAYDVDPTVAGAAGESIKTAADAIDTAINGIDLDDTMLENLKTGAETDKATALAAISALEIKPTDYSTVKSSWDTAAGTLSGMAESLLDQITASLTDGLKDDPDDPTNSFAQSVQAVTDYFDAVEAAIDAWKAAKLKEIEESGLTGDDLTNAINAVNEQADAMYSHLTTLESGVQSWMEEMAGKPKEYVEAHVQELRDMLAEAMQIDAQIRAFSSGLNVNQGETHRTAVKQGLITDQEGILKAIAFTTEEYDNAVKAAATEFENSTAEAAEKYGENSDEYAKAYDDALAKRNQAIADANEKRGTEMDAIMKATLWSDEAFRGVYDSLMDEAQASKDAQTVRDSINQILQDAFDNDLGVLDIDVAKGMLEGLDVDWDTLASNLGFEGEGAADALREKLAEVMNSAVSNGETVLDLGTTQFAVDFETLASGLETSLTEALTSGSLDFTGAYEVFAAAVKAGLINGVSADASDADIGSAFTEQITNSLQDTDFSAIGKDATAGIATGAKDTSAFVGVGKPGAAAIENEFRNELQSHSPSQLMVPVGEDVTAGVAQGIAQGVSTLTSAAATVARSTYSALNGAFTGLYSVGRNITRGLAKGILDGKETVVNAAKSVAQAAAQAMQGILDINSPSKVTEKFGEYFDLGFVKGIEGNVRAINNAIDGALNLGAPTRGAYAQTVRTSQASQGIDYDRLASAMSQQPIVMNVNGKNFARVTRSDTARESNSRSRAIALGYGK